MDMRSPELSGRFDHIVSVCVFEHLPMAGRIQVSRRLRDLLTGQGTFSLTFDYLNPEPTPQINSPAAVHAQFVLPSGLRMRGNERFHDAGERYLLHLAYHPDAGRRGWRTGGGDDTVDGRYTFGALFMEAHRESPAERS
jgi:hypothetical protein